MSPEVIFDAAPGELLVARNVANLVPRYEPGGGQHGASAALEFAVRALQVAHIVVLGHAFCGGIKAFASDDAPLSSSDFIGKWMSQIAPAAQGHRAPGWGGRGGLSAQAGIRLGRTQSQESDDLPLCESGGGEGELHLHGAYFGVASGRLLVRNETTGVFEPVG